MPNAYNSIFTGGHNDEYDIRITALERGPITYKSSLVTNGVQPTDNVWDNGFEVADKDGVLYGAVKLVSRSDSTKQGITLGAIRNINDTVATNNLNLYLDNEGVPTVGLTSQQAWLSALGLNDITRTTTISQVITANSTNATISSVDYAQWGRIAMVRIVWTNKSAISVPASGNIGNIQVGTLVNGKRPKIFCHAHSNGDNAGAAWYSVGTDGVINLGACESTGSARTIAANQTFSLCATYILA